MEKKKRGKLLPAIRARMGDWIYYVSYMKMQDIAKRISFAEEIHESQTLNEFLQRRVTDRSDEIAKYIETQQQRFFNSIIVGVYGGSPEWYELEVGKNEFFDPKKLPDDLKNSLGFLKLSGTEKLFAIDGQHRLAAIRKVVSKNAAFKDEEVAVIFVSAKKDDEGLKRTRRLFSTLNRYAKPVKLSDIISLDEDDVVAISTRRLLDVHTLFKNDLIYTKTKQLPTSDKRSLTSIHALYESLDIFLNDMGKKSQWEEFKRFRPSDEQLDRYYKKAEIFWNDLIESFGELGQLRAGHTHIITEKRHSRGGHLLFRPVGLLAIARAAKLAQDSGFRLKRALNLIASAPMMLSRKPWVGLLWDDIGKKMITRKENQKIASNLLFYIIGGNLTKIKMTERELKKAYASALNKAEEDVELPEKVS